MTVQQPPPMSLDALARLGVPTFVLVVILFLAVPRADAAIDKLARIETQLAVVAASCDVRLPTAPR